MKYLSPIRYSFMVSKNWSYLIIDYFQLTATVLLVKSSAKEPISASTLKACVMALTTVETTVMRILFSVVSCCKDLISFKVWTSSVNCWLILCIIGEQLVARVLQISFVAMEESVSRRIGFVTHSKTALMGQMSHPLVVDWLDLCTIY